LNEEAIASSRGVRRGNMGHITSIAVNVSNTPNIEALIQQAVGKHEAWEKYKDGVLLETVEKNRTAYGGASGYSQEDAFGVGSSIEVSLNMSDDMDDLEEEGDGFEDSIEWQAEAPPIKSSED